MSLAFLLATDVVSEPLRPEPSPTLLRKLSRHAGEMAIPSVVWHELRFGCRRLPESKRRDAIERYLDEVVAPAFVILDYDRAAAEWHAAERARLFSISKPASFADGQIAAIACVNDLVLVTADRKGFAGFKGLRIERWV